MRVKSMLVLLSGEESDQAILDTAYRAARLSGAHLHCLHPRPDPLQSLPPLEIAGAGIERIVRQARQQVDARTDAARAAYEAALATYGPSERATPSAAEGEETGVSASFEALTPESGESVAERARIHDIAVVSVNARIGEAEGLLENVLFESGRPVLVAPAQPSALIGSQVAIAWNRGALAARAVAAAMPLLETAAGVTVVHIETGARRGPGPTELVQHLAWHGIDAGARTIDPDGGNVGKLLLGEAKSCGADLLVMGAYSHSRLREMVLGGVTKYVLAHAELPVLMCH
jgi:nucleotide-binding universal stress UspA family protein